jgi:imidazolonepropionase-like amidohydrolase
MRFIILFLVALFLLLDIVYSQPRPIALTNINYVDVIDGTIRIGETIVLEDGVIVRIGKGITSENAEIIDCEGKWAVPGLCDAHIHIFQSGGLYTRPDVIDLQKYKPYSEERQWLIDNTTDLLRRYLLCGVTSVIDMGGPFYDFDLRDKYNDGKNYPNLFITGPLISTYQPDAFKIDDAPILIVTSSQQAIDIIDKQIPHKTDFVKIWYIARYDESAEQNYEIVKSTIDHSHKLGLKTAVHATELKTAKLALKAGADLLVHSVDEPIDDEFITLAKANNAIIIPTLIVTRKYIDVFLQEMENTEVDLNYANPYVLGSLYDLKKFGDYSSLIKRKAFTPEGKKRWFEQDRVRKENLKLMVSRGIKIATGTDAGNIGTMHGSSYFEEIKYMSDAGMSNMEIIKASTINGAAVLGNDKKLGSIESGKIADIVILNSNPIENLDALKDIHTVVKGGNLIVRNDVLVPSPEQLAQQQVNAYNARNLEAFLEPYSEDCEIYDFGGQMIMKGKEKMRARYSELFAQSPALFCNIENRIVQQRTVIDQEKVTGMRGSSNIARVIAIYTIANNKIAKVHFIRWEEK